MALVRFSRHKDDHTTTPDRTWTAAKCHSGRIRTFQESEKKRFSLGSMISFPGATLRRGNSLTLSRLGLRHILQRLRRKGHAGEVVPIHLMREQKAALLVQMRGVSVREQALRALGGFLNIPCLPRQDGPKSCSAPHSPDGASPNGEANKRENLRKGDVAHRDGGFVTVSNRGCETIIAQRHCAASPHEPNKPRSTYIEESEHATKQVALEKHFDMYSMADSISRLQLGATMMDLKSDLEWLNPSASLGRNFDVLDGTTKKDNNEGTNMATIYMDEPERDDRSRAANLADSEDRITEEGTRNGSLPELDSGYQTSESGLSIPEDLAAEHFTPAQAMLNLLPMDIDGRFGSFYSEANDYRTQVLHGRKDSIYADQEMCQSRFSWGSSIYSDGGLSSVSEVDVWWKPIKPLVVNKEPAKTPPIPQRNPLRLLKRIRESVPKGFGENVRVSRNIHNLHLDLPKPGKIDVRRSWRDSISSRKRPHTPVKKETQKLSASEHCPHLVAHGHIFQAMRASEQGTEMPNDMGERKRARRSGKARAATNTQEKNHDTGNVISRLGSSEQLRKARGHIRAASDPLHGNGTRNANATKWNESMPAHGCIRRSCIPSIANVTNRSKPGLALAINKRLPPLPVAMEVT
jgi:hypothetical protein